MAARGAGTTDPGVILGATRRFLGALTHALKPGGITPAQRARRGRTVGKITQRRATFPSRFYPVLPPVLQQTGG